MPLWKANTDPGFLPTEKPRWLTTPNHNTANRKVKKNQNPANTYGVARSSTANNLGKGYSPGWATIQRGTGPVKQVNVTVLTPGNFTVNSNVSVAFASPTGSGANGIAQFTAGNLTSILVDAGGAGYANAPSVTISGGNGNTTASQLVAVVGGRAGRVSYELLVALGGDMASKDPANTNNLGLNI